MADPLEVIAEKAVRDVAIATQTALQRAAPAYVQRSIDVTVKGTGAHAVATVRARGFSSIVIAGQRSHTIEPVQAGALAWSGGDHPIGIVHHPMVPANDFVSRGVLAAERPVTAVLDTAAEAMGELIADRFADGVD
jgi:hypothetical protein